MKCTEFRTQPQNKQARPDRWHTQSVPMAQPAYQWARGLCCCHYNHAPRPADSASAVEVLSHCGQSIFPFFGINNLCSFSVFYRRKGSDDTGSTGCRWPRRGMGVCKSMSHPGRSGDWRLGGKKGRIGKYCCDIPAINSANVKEWTAA